jgi:REP element-mobilizing transposase RayT
VPLQAAAMARKLRLEFPGACYHVINRGNYRSDIFAADRTKKAFEDCLFEACEKSGWLLVAYIMMRNHFHLALETPHGNLVTGMQWLQATFANRFNRLRRSVGHLFQGRYKAYLVEEGEPLAAVASYIHLNPVRAKIIPVERLSEYRYSSYWYLRNRAQRPPWLRIEAVLAHTDGLADTPQGWASYDAHLRWQAAEGPLGRAEAFKQMSQGWAIGSADFKATLLRDHAIVALARAWEAKGADEIRIRAWEELCQRGLVALSRSETELARTPGAVRWKVALAAFLKERSQASNGWIGRRLHLGCAKYVSRLVAAARRSSPPSPELTSLRGHGET